MASANSSICCGRPSPGHHVAAVEQADGHVLPRPDPRLEDSYGPLPRITLHHLVSWLKAGLGDLLNSRLLMEGLLRGHHRGVGHQGEVNPEGSKKKVKIEMTFDLGYGTKLCWNSFRSTLRAPSNLREAVMDETI